MADKHIKRCWISLIIRQMHIKTIMRYHLRLVRVAIIKKSTDNKSWRGCGEKGTLLFQWFVHSWWNFKLIHLVSYSWKKCKLIVIMENSIEIPWKLGINLPYDPATPLLGIYHEETIIEKVTGTPVFMAAAFTIARTWKQPRCPLANEWVKKLCLYTMKYCSVIKKKNTFESVLVK